MYVGHIAAYRRTRSPGRLAWSEGWRPSGAGLRTSDEPGELSKWLSRDDSTINIVIRISIIIVIIIIIIITTTTTDAAAAVMMITQLISVLLNLYLA